MMRSRIVPVDGKPLSVASLSATVAVLPGLDTDATKSMESETYVLGNGHYQIEVMTNLNKLPPTGAWIVATWPKVKGGLGFPARVFAVLP